MEKSTGCVLKAEKVNIQGSVRLDVGRPVQKQAFTSGPVARAPQVEIVEKTDAFSIIEIICTCGTKTRIRCEYGNTSA